MPAQRACTLLGISYPFLFGSNVVSVSGRTRAKSRRPKSAPARERYIRWQELSTDTRREWNQSDAKRNSKIEGVCLHKGHVTAVTGKNHHRGTLTGAQENRE